MNTFELVSLANADYVDEQYQRWRADPGSVDDRWALFFSGFDFALDGNGARPLAADGATGDGHGTAAIDRAAEPVIGVFDLVHSYRELGHLVAHLNPLAPAPEGHPLLEPSEFGFGDPDMDRVIECGSFQGCSTATLRDLIRRLQATYCQHLGVEYLHIQDREQRLWLQERMEPTSNHPALSRDERLRIFDRLMVAESF